MPSVENQIQQLRRWVGGLSALTLGLLLALGYLWQRQSSRELTLERLNIVEPNGQLKLVISNDARQHPGMLGGRALPARQRGPGLVFFNEAGDECGGLLYNGNAQEASMVYSVDQFRNDQIMQLQYSQHAGASGPVRSYGLRLWDRPDSFPLSQELAYVDSLRGLRDTAAFQAGVRHLQASGRLGAERLFAGQTTMGETGLFVRDAKGRVRLKVYVNQQGQPLLELLDETGRPLPAPTARQGARP